MKKKIIGILVCTLLIACVFGSAKSENKFPSIKERNEIIAYSDSAPSSEDVTQSSIGGSYIAQLDYACMCDWVLGWQNHGPPKTKFNYGALVYFYGEISNIQSGDIFKSEWKKDGVVYVRGEWDPMEWPGTACIWHWWTPSSVGTWQVFIYCNDEYIGSGPQFTVSLPNNPPNTPGTPSGPSNLKVGEPGTYSTSANDPDGDQVQYRFDWDADGIGNISDWTSLGASGHTGSLSHSWGSAGTYVVKAQAKDDNGVRSSWSSGLTVVIYEVNQPPNKPFLTGPLSGKAGNSYTYSASATDPDGDEVFFWFDWDDGDEVGWLGKYASGEICNLSHVWQAEGNYSIKVKAKDTNNLESGWTSLSVSMPKNKPYINTPFLNFLQNHPLIYQLIQRFINL